MVRPAFSFAAPVTSIGYSYNGGDILRYHLQSVQPSQRQQPLQQPQFPHRFLYRQPQSLQDFFADSEVRSERRQEQVFMGLSIQL
jgi:hypothetical protein